MPLGRLLFALGEEAGEVTTLNGAPAASFCAGIFFLSYPSSFQGSFEQCSEKQQPRTACVFRDAEYTAPRVVWNLVVNSWELLLLDNGKATAYLTLSVCKSLSTLGSSHRQNPTASCRPAFSGSQAGWEFKL